jgi:hypothetical protein
MPEFPPIPGQKPNSAAEVAIMAEKETEYVNLMQP